MSLQFIAGSSGSGKSFYIYNRIIRESRKYPEKNYMILVPDQFTMQTQKTMVDMSDGGGILNIDVLSFERLAYRVFEEVGGDGRTVLEETGKGLILQKIVQEHLQELPYLGSQLKKPGYISEVKSILSEFMQYDLSEENLDQMLKWTENKALLQHKLKDIQVLYRGFQDFLKDHFITGEEILDVLTEKIRESRTVKGCTVVLDGYTGFTPIQMKLIRVLLEICEKVYVTVTIDPSENIWKKPNPYELFYMSKQMVQTIAALSREAEGCILEEILILDDPEKCRYANRDALRFLEQNLFRNKKARYQNPDQQEVFVREFSGPNMELQSVVREILFLVREKQYRFGDFAVVAGDQASYSGVARRAFEEAGIPYFLDEKHTVLMNPFVEFIRAAMNMAEENYSYESVFRYLRCGMSDLTKEETDLLENYCLAVGIRGKKAWCNPFTKISRGMKEEDLESIEILRLKFQNEVQVLMDEFTGRGKTVETYTKGLCGFIINSQIQEKLKMQEELFREQGNPAMEKEYAQIYRIVIQMLERLVEILGEEKVTRSEYQQLLETGLLESKVALIPPSVDQVLIGDIERTRLKDIKVLFLVGVNDGFIPKTKDLGGIVTELDRDYLKECGAELAPGAKELINQQRFYLYLNMTKPEDRLYLSYSKADLQGKVGNPSYLIGMVRKLFPDCMQDKRKENLLPEELQHPGISLEWFGDGLKDYMLGITESYPEEMAVDKEIYDRSQVWKELYRWYMDSPEYKERADRIIEAAFRKNPQDKISQAVAAAIFGELDPYAATRLERYSACAFAYFLQYGLSLREREEYEFKPLDMGNIIHRTLEGFAKELRRKKLSWEKISEEDRRKMVRECLERETASYGNTILHSTSRNEYLITRAEELVNRTVWAMQKQLERGNFVPEGFEVSLTGGRIDRLDICEEDDKVYVKIIDYKTGNADFDLLALYHGLQLQLVVYMNGALEMEQIRHPDKEIIPAGIFYYNVKDPLLKNKAGKDLEELEEEFLKELKMKGLVLADGEVVKKIDVSSATVPASVTKAGVLSKNSSAASKEQFQIMSDFVKDKARQTCGDIKKGEISVQPYQLKQKKACDYCPYVSVCGFDPKIPGYEYRRLKEFSDETIWEKMKEEVEQAQDEERMQELYIKKEKGGLENGD